MSTSEISKLETRWRENPQGLTFAPLAEAYRKMGEPARALEVLADGLSRHADYIPASIVLGRCHLDLNDDAQAEEAFMRVLSLDDENVIALKALADLAERQGRFDDGERWLRELLLIDRSNDEARAQLTRLDEARAAAPDVEPPVESAAEVEGEVEDDGLELEEPWNAEAEAAAWDADEAPAEAPAEVSAEEQEVEPLPDLMLEEPPIESGSAPVPPMEGLERNEEVELSPASADSELQLESASEDWEVTAEPELEDDDDAASEDASEPELVVTESMAELYLRQGHRAEALQVYRGLYRRNRDDFRLREKVDALETELAAEEAGEPDAAVYAARDAARSVAAFLTGILAARPGDPPSSWNAASGAETHALDRSGSDAATSDDGAPTRPASDHLSLSSVFGEESSPAAPAQRAAPVETTDEESDVSFDAFFGGEQSAGASQSRGAAREDDDLDQFHDWLQNLKR